MDPIATLPSIGETWLADLGPDTPLGHFTVEITFITPSVMTFNVTGGDLLGRTETMDYTTTKIRDGLYAVRWTEPDSGDHVTHIEDYTSGTCMASSVIGGEFVQLHGSWSRVR
jgi:hypothetical protein